MFVDIVFSFITDTHKYLSEVSIDKQKKQGKCKKRREHADGIFRSGTRAQSTSLHDHQYRRTILFRLLCRPSCKGSSMANKSYEYRQWHRHRNQK